MASRGNVMVIVDDHHYGFYSHTLDTNDIAKLLEEAAGISEADGWPEIVDQWVGKTWLTSEDDKLSRKLRNSVKHPDGESIPTNRWSYCMRPRLSRTEMAERYGENRASATYDSGNWPIVVDASWRKAAAMPAMLHEPMDRADRENTVLIDYDEKKAVWLNRVSGQVVMACDLTDVETLRDVAANCKEDMNYHQNHSVPAWMWRGELTSPHNVDNLDSDYESAFADGQWLRPNQFPPRRRTPWEYPAQKYAVTAQQRIRAAQKNRPTAQNAVKDLQTSDPASILAEMTPVNCSMDSADRCKHIGVRTHKRCVRFEHTDKNHVYS